jgi:hypothetical protein
VAAGGPEQADGSQSAGFISVDGSYTQLTADASGYGEVLQKWPIGFNPESGDLWYMTPQGQGGAEGIFGHVDPDVGPESDTVVEDTTPTANSAIGGYNNRVFFRPDGFPSSVAALTLAGMVFLPGGIEVTRDWGFKIAPYGETTVDSPETTPVQPADADIGWPRVPVDDKSFITEFEEQIYLNTIESGSVSVKPLLPDSNRNVGDIVVSPDGETAVFVSFTGSLVELWAINLSGDSEPVQLTGFDPDLEPSHGLIDWLP